jgi:hypothetical protein
MRRPSSHARSTRPIRSLPSPIDPARAVGLTKTIIAGDQGRRPLTRGIGRAALTLSSIASATLLDVACREQAKHARCQRRSHRVKSAEKGPASIRLATTRARRSRAARLGRARSTDSVSTLSHIHNILMRATFPFRQSGLVEYCGGGEAPRQFGAQCWERCRREPISLSDLCHAEETAPPASTGHTVGMFYSRVRFRRVGRRHCKCGVSGCTRGTRLLWPRGDFLHPFVHPRWDTSGRFFLLAFSIGTPTHAQRSKSRRRCERIG